MTITRHKRFRGEIIGACVAAFKPTDLQGEILSKEGVRLKRAEGVKVTQIWADRESTTGK